MPRSEHAARSPKYGVFALRRTPERFDPVLRTSCDVLSADFEVLRHWSFPPVGVRADRRSAIESQGLSVRDGLIQEWYNGREALVKDGAAGAARFKNGLGRHGDFTKIC